MTQSAADDTPENTNEPVDVTPETESAETPETPEAPAEQDLQAALEEARAKANENWERFLRATAEQDNIRKRAERDIDHARKFAVEKFAKDLIEVLDSLDLGLQSAEKADDVESAERAVIEGVKLTRKVFVDALGKHGVVLIEAKGETFNPDRHEAMSAVPTADHAPNTVIDVVQRGYLLNDRVLRPAMVIVSQALPSS